MYNFVFEWVYIMLSFLLKLFTWSSLIITKYQVAKNTSTYTADRLVRDPATAVVWLDSEQGFEDNLVKVVNNNRAVDYWSGFKSGG